jgi:outer membrane lipoprotein carrier protein
MSGGLLNRGTAPGPALEYQPPRQPGGGPPQPCQVDRNRRVLPLQGSDLLFSRFRIRGAVFSALGFALMLALTAMPAKAAEAPPVTASQLAHRVDSYYNHLHSLRADFRETYQGLGVNREEHGTLLLRKPGKMRWTYAQPQGKVFILNGKYGWFYTPGDSHAERLAISKMDDMRSPLRFLLGHTQLEKEFAGLRLAAESDGYRLSGAPKGMEQQVAEITLGVTMQGVIRSMTITEVNGARTSFTFTNGQPDAPAPPSEFVFTPPAGVTVIDGMPPV